MPWRIALAFALAPLLTATVAVTGHRMSADPDLTNVGVGAAQRFGNGDIVMEINPGGLGTGILLAAAFFAYPCALLLGVPALLALRSAGRLRIAPIMLAGAFISIAWLTALAGFAIATDLYSATTSDSGLRPETTLSDLLLVLRATVAFGVLGSIGGGAFWFLAIADWRRHVGTE